MSSPTCDAVRVEPALETGREQTAAPARARGRAARASGRRDRGSVPKACELGLDEARPGAGDDQQVGALRHLRLAQRRPALEVEFSLPSRSRDAGEAARRRTRRATLAVAGGEQDLRLAALDQLEDGAGERLFALEAGELGAAAVLQRRVVVVGEVDSSTTRRSSPLSKTTTSGSRAGTCRPGAAPRSGSCPASMARK